MLGLQDHGESQVRTVRSQEAVGVTMSEPAADPVCIEQGCTSPADAERPITPDVVELVCHDHEVPTR